MADAIRFNLRKIWKESGPKAGAHADPFPVISGSVTPEEALQGAVHAVLLTDENGRIQAASEAAARMLGYSRDELTAHHLADVVARMDEGIIGLAVKAYEAGRRVVLDAVGYRRDGSTFPCECVLYLVSTKKQAARQLYFLLTRETGKGKADSGDVIDAKLVRAERLEMAGTLAGQIAHDFNNLLTPLLAYPDLIRRELPAGGPVTEYIDIIEKTGNDMSRLTQQLLSLSRRGHVGDEVIDVNSVVEQVVKFMQAAVAPGIMISMELAHDLLPVKGGKDQLRRVVENLCQNAVDAMAERGRLAVRTENIYLDSPIGQNETVNLGEYVEISVSDTGTGIPPEIQEQIFDPFFTTKRGGKVRGSGLGLSIVHGIVRDHKGYVDLETAVGEGSTFRVYLPVYRSVTPKLEGLDLPRGHEAVLVVDDDELQVGMMITLLQALGYKAMGASSGEECLGMLRDEGYRFDLIILDMLLNGGMDGLATFEAIRRIVPLQKTILVSGYSKMAHNVVKAQELGAGAYLRKPLTLERVGRAVRDALDADAKPAAVVPKKEKRILIVDDEQMIRKLFGMIIMTEMPDALIDQACNGQEAVKAFEEGHHDLLVMDLQMPVQNGREAFAAISKLCVKKGWVVPPVIFCTGFSPPASLTAIIGDGSQHRLLRKPVKADVFLATVRQCLHV